MSINDHLATLGEGDSINDRLVSFGETGALNDRLKATTEDATSVNDAMTAWGETGALNDRIGAYTGPSAGLDAQVLADEPLGYWKLDDATGTTAVDSSGNGKNGTYNGTPSLASRSFIGGMYADFDGTNDYMSVALDPKPTTGITIECWTMLDALPTDAAVISNIFDGGHISLEMGAAVDTQGTTQRVLFSFSPNNHINATNGTGTVNAPWVVDTLYHLVGTHDGTTMRFYINNTLVGSKVCNFTVGSANWAIGRRHDTSFTPYWNGVIANAAIYDHALSADRVSAHYTALVS